MRTTVTLEPDLAKKIKALAHRQGLTFKQALNEALRRGLVAPARDPAKPRYQVEPHPSGFLPGVDPGKLNQLVDQLEAEEFIASQRR